MQQWMGAQASEDLAISEWVIAEFSAALSIKLRTKQISTEYRADALAEFAQMRGESLTTLPVFTAHFRTAARFADEYALGLRASDALHLAICADYGATLCTLDARLAQAGAKLGLKTHLL